MYFSASNANITAFNADGSPVWSSQMSVSDEEKKAFHVRFMKDQPLLTVVEEGEDAVFVSVLNHVASLKKTDGSANWAIDLHRNGGEHAALSGFFYPLMYHRDFHLLFSVVNQHRGKATKAHKTHAYELKGFKGPYALVAMTENGNPTIDAGHVDLHFGSDELVFNVSILARGPQILVASTPLRGRTLMKTDHDHQGSGCVIGVDWPTRKEMWKTPIPSHFPVHVCNAPNHVAVCSGLDVFLLDPTSGNIVAKQSMPPVSSGDKKMGHYRFGEHLHSMVFANGALFVAHAETIFSLDANSLDLRWSALVNNLPTGTATLMAVHPGMGALFATTGVGGELTRFNLDGTIVWKSQGVVSDHKPANRFQPPHHNDGLHVCDELLIVAADDLLRVHNTQTGSELPTHRSTGHNQVHALATSPDASTALTETTLYEEREREHQAHVADTRDMFLWWLWPPMGLAATIGWSINRGKKSAADKTWNE